VRVLSRSSIDDGEDDDVDDHDDNKSDGGCADDDNNKGNNDVVGESQRVGVISCDSNYSLEGHMQDLSLIYDHGDY